MNKFVLIGLLISCLARLGAQESDLQFSIRFYNKEIYTNLPEKPILIQVAIRNQGPNLVWFNMPSQSVFQLVFKVMSAGRTGLYLPVNEKLKEARFSNQPIFFRDIVLQPEEEFSYVVNLKDFVDIEETGVYTVEAEFYPALVPGLQEAKKQSFLSQISQAHDFSETSLKTLLRSNILTLSVRPLLPSSMALVYQENMDEERQDYLQRENKNPDEVIRYLLKARQEEKRERFLLYFNFFELYQRAPGFRRSFLSLSAEEQSFALEGFKEDLWKREEALIKVPSAFSILATSYTERDATVVAALEFDGGDYKENREYKYSLKRNNGYWEVVDYQVRLLGTERKAHES